MTNQSNILYWVGHKFRLGFSLLIGQSNNTRKMLVMKKKNPVNSSLKCNIVRCPNIVRNVSRSLKISSPSLCSPSFADSRSRCFSGHHDGCGARPCGDCESLRRERVFQLSVTLWQAALQGVWHTVGAERTGTGIREFCAPTLFSCFQTLQP